MDNETKEKLIERIVDIHFKLNEMLTILQATDIENKPIKFTIISKE